MKIRAFNGDLPALKSLDSGLLALDAPRGLVPDFTVFTSAMEAPEAEPGIVRMIGSSTARDLQRDTMTLQALSDMAQAPAKLTIWLNHTYELPGSIFGSLVEAPKLVQQGGIADLYIASDVEMSNPAAAQTYKYIQNGRRIGCSVGAMVLEYEIDEEADDGDSWFPPIIITRVLPLEWSVCGIPANQRCWVEQAIKGVFARSFDQRLAPAVKGMFPRLYGDLIAGCPNAALRRDLERTAARPTHPSRPEWVPLTKTFVLNTRGRAEAMEAAHLGEFIEKNVPDLRRFVPTDAEIIKGACGKTTWPLADRDTAWDSGEAHKRIQDWAGGDEPDWAKVASVHLWKADGAEAWGDFKLPFCDIIGGSVKAVPRAIFAVAGVLQGARGGAEIDDEEAVKSRVETYYARMRTQFDDPDITVPWGDGKAAEPEKVAETTPQQALVAEAQVALVAQYNLLGLALGLPPVARDASTGALLFSAGQEPPVEAFTRAVEGVLAIQKAGAEFSQENQGHLVALHKTLRAMTDGKICGMDGDDDADDNGDQNNTVGGHGGPAPEAMPTERQFAEITRSLEMTVREAVGAQIGALTTALDGLNVKALAQTVAVAQNSLLNLRKEIGEVREEAAQAAQAASQLLNMPMGQPTRFAGRQASGAGVAAYGDFLSASGQPNAAKWQGTLEQAVAQCRYEDLSVGDGYAAKYRVWPEGVGGSVRDGVRPALDGGQKSLMRPDWILAYQEGREARVPLLDLAEINAAP